MEMRDRLSRSRAITDAPQTPQTQAPSLQREGTSCSECEQVARTNNCECVLHHCITLASSHS
jgi:hypothetical protein